MGRYLPMDETFWVNFIFIYDGSRQTDGQTEERMDRPYRRVNELLPSYYYNVSGRNEVKLSWNGTQAPTYFLFTYLT